MDSWVWMKCALGCVTWDVYVHVWHSVYLWSGMQARTRSTTTFTLYVVSVLCMCTLYTFPHKLYIRTLLQTFCKEIAFCSVCSSLQPCSGSHESCAVRTQVARPAGEHGILYHNREEVCWLRSVSSQFSCKLLSGIHVPSFHFSCRKEAELAAAMEKRRVSLIIRN